MVRELIVSMEAVGMGVLSHEHDPVARMLTHVHEAQMMCTYIAHVIYFIFILLRDIK